MNKQLFFFFSFLVFKINTLKGYLATTREGGRQKGVGAGGEGMEQGGRGG